MDYETALQFEETMPLVLISVIGFLVVVINLISVLIFCKIFSKAGYHWTLGLLTLVPIVNGFLPFFLAFADWPAQKELRELRQRVSAGSGRDAYRR
jgi:hypothetical protein